MAFFNKNLPIFITAFLLIFDSHSSFFRLISAQKHVKNTNLSCLGILDRPCVCNDRIINCTNAGFKSTDVFLQISDAQWPLLDTLIMTGNEFTELEPYLFGPGYMHKQLKYLDLSRNNIQFIDIQAFRNLPRLEHVKLNGNNLTTEKFDERDYQFFHHLETLKILELESAFNKSASSEDISRIVKYILGPLNRLTKLEYLHLQGNNLTLLNESTFCQLPALEFLYLQNNSLLAFGGHVINERCTPSLVELWLDNNRLERMSGFQYQKFDSDIHLEKISFANNPFDCNCDLKEFLTWYKRNLYRVTNQNKTTCHRAIPNRYRNRPLAEVDEESLRCESDEFVDYMHNVYVVCGLALIGLVALIFCLFYTNRSFIFSRLPPSFYGRRGSKNGLRVTSDGYEILDKEPRIKAEDV